MNTRRKYSQEFKREAVNLVILRGYTITEAAQNLDIQPSLLGRWKRELYPNLTRLNASPDKLPLHEEISRLKRENHRLKTERDILKKAVIYFANKKR